MISREGARSLPHGALGSGLPGFRYPMMLHDADADIARMAVSA